MKVRSLFVLTVVCGFSMFFNVDGCECLASGDYDCFIAQVDDKIYVNPKKVIIAEKGFYINVENTMMPVGSLFSDSNGIYLSASRESRQGWTCPVCFVQNPPEKVICINVRNHWKYESE